MLIIYSQSFISLHVSNINFKYKILNNFKNEEFETENLCQLTIIKQNERQNEKEEKFLYWFSDIGYVILNLESKLYFISQYPNLKPHTIFCLFKVPSSNDRFPVHSLEAIILNLRQG